MRAEVRRRDLLHGYLRACITRFLHRNRRFLATLSLSRQFEVSMIKVRSAIFVLAFLSACLTPCFAHHTAVVVNKDNTVENVTSVHLAKIIRGEIKKWPDGKNIVLFLHRASAV